MSLTTEHEMDARSESTAEQVSAPSSTQATSTVNEGDHNNRVTMMGEKEGEHAGCSREKEPLFLAGRGWRKESVRTAKEGRFLRLPAVSVLHKVSSALQIFTRSRRQFPGGGPLTSKIRAGPSVKCDGSRQ